MDRYIIGYFVMLIILTVTVAWAALMVHDALIRVEDKLDMIHKFLERQME